MESLRKKIVDYMFLIVFIKENGPLFLFKNGRQNLIELRLRYGVVETNGVSCSMIR